MAITIKLPVSKYLFNAFVEIAEKKHVPPEQIEREALITYLRIIGHYDPYNMSEQALHDKRVKSIKENLVMLKKCSKKKHTRYEF